LLLVTAVLTVFGRLIFADFSSLDDPYNIYLNPRLNPPTWESIGYYWSHSETGLYIPVTYTAWGLIASLTRVAPDPNGIALNPGGFHLASVAGHVISTLAVLGILGRLLQDRRAACMGAMLYAMHPLQVESVGWAAGLKDVLAGMFGLLAIRYYLRFAQDGKRVAYPTATILFVAAMLSKPSAMMVALIVVLIDRFLLGREWKVVLRCLAPWFGLALVCAVVARIAQDVTGVPAAPLWARPLIALDSLAFYTYKLICPIRLAVDYGHRPAVVLANGLHLWTWSIPAAIGVTLWWNRRRARPIAVGALIFVAATLPVLGLATFQYQFASTTADHYVYLAMLGPALMVGWLVHRWQTGGVMIAVALLIGLMGIRSIVQARLWMDDVSLFENAVSVNPTSRLALNNLGHAYQVAGQMPAAEEQFRRVSELYPDYPEGHSNMAFALEARGAYAEAAAYRRKSIDAIEKQPAAVRSDLMPQLLALGNDLFDLGRYDEAKAVFSRALGMQPNNQNIRSAIEKAENAQRETTMPASSSRPTTQ
jgi:hypothetical protein